MKPISLLARVVADLTEKTCCEQTKVNCNQGRDCQVRLGTHKPVEALIEIEEPKPAAHEAITAVLTGKS